MTPGLGLRPERDALLWVHPPGLPLLPRTVPSLRKEGARLQRRGVGPLSPEEERKVRVTDLRSFCELWPWERREGERAAGAGHGAGEGSDLAKWVPCCKFLIGSPGG